MTSALHALHTRAGRPSSRTLSAKMGNVSHSYVHQVLKGAKLPSWPILAKLVRALDGDVESFRELWISAKSAGEKADDLPSPSRRVASDVSVFVSYAHVDDQATHGRLRAFVEDVANMYKSFTGLDVQVFVDRDSIPSGESWRDRIRLGLASSSIMLAFVTPAYLRSPNCVEEFTEFFSFLRVNSQTRLILPLLFFARERLERQFKDDLLWQEISEIQTEDISVLRTEERGSGLWVRRVELVADAIDEVLSSVSVDENSTTEPIAADEMDDDNDFGILETRARIEEEAPEIAAAIQRMGDLLEEIGGIATDATPELQAADSFRKKLTLTQRIAQSFSPIAEEMDTISQRVRGGVEEWRLIIDPVFAEIRQGEVETTDAIQFIQTVEQMCEASGPGLDAMIDFAGSVDQIRGQSASLDKPLKLIRSSALRFAELRAVFKEWQQQVTDLREEGFLPQPA